jgi:mRNA-degrading endonuclease RelE of RelBE toxin-antitoxin system
MMDSDHFEFKELILIYSGLKQLQSSRIGFEHRTVLTGKLTEAWQTEPFGNESAKEDRKIPVTEGRQRGINLLWFIRRRPQQSELLEEREQIGKRLKRVIASKPSWLSGMTTEFVKAGQGIDPEPRRRIVQAIESVSKNPTKPMGDTVRPLAGELKGLWCYRVEGYRIVYSPDIPNKRVTLVAVTSE